MRRLGQVWDQCMPYLTHCTVVNPVCLHQVQSRWRSSRFLPTMCLHMVDIQGLLLIWELSPKSTAEHCTGSQSTECSRLHLLAMEHKSDVLLQGCWQANHYSSYNASKSVSAQIVAQRNQSVWQFLHKQILSRQMDDNACRPQSSSHEAFCLTCTAWLILFDECFYTYSSDTAKHICQTND